MSHFSEEVVKEKRLGYQVIFNDFIGMEALMVASNNLEQLKMLKRDHLLYLEKAKEHETPLTNIIYSAGVKADASYDDAGLHQDYLHLYKKNTIKYVRMIGMPGLTTLILSNEGKAIPLYNRYTETVSKRTGIKSNRVTNFGTECYANAGFLKPFPEAAIFNSNRPHTPPSPGRLKGQMRALISFQNEHGV